MRRGSTGDSTSMVNASTERPPSLPDDVAALQAMVLAQRAEFAELQAARLAHEAELGAELAAARAGLIEQRFEIEALKTRLSKLLRLSFGTSSEKLRTHVEQLELTLGDIDELLAEIGSGTTTSAVLDLVERADPLQRLRLSDDFVFSCTSQNFRRACAMQAASTTRLP